MYQLYCIYILKGKRGQFLCCWLCVVLNVECHLEPKTSGVALSLALLVCVRGECHGARVEVKDNL